MARIIYKKGCEGQNWLESIEGIEIGLLNGQRALIYPKYAEREMLKVEQIWNWDARVETEIKVLKVENTMCDTDELLEIGSPAAEWVKQFHSEKYGIFALPSLLAAMEIQDQKEDIDALAKTIEGADLLQNYTDFIWSCSRYSDKDWWVMGGHFGIAGGNSFYHSNLAVPTILY